MPELPEVETTRRGLAPHLEGRRIVGVTLRRPDLRWPIPREIETLLPALTIRAVRRRAKYLLMDTDAGAALWHLGMSGSLRLVAPGTPPQKHDHVDLVFMNTTLRFRDPRRFGTLLWHEGGGIEAHPLIAVLGIEPLTEAVDGDWLYEQTRRRSAPIKPLLMDSHLVVGIGNIYAAESLFAAGISPLRAANRIGRERYRKLVPAIREVLETSIAAGGSSVRDYVHSDGGAGCFQLCCAVYDRAGQPCPTCGQPVRAIRQSGRSTFYCPRCQH